MHVIARPGLFHMRDHAPGRATYLLAAAWANGAASRCSMPPLFLPASGKNPGRSSSSGPSRPTAPERLYRVAAVSSHLEASRGRDRMPTPR